MFQCSMLTFGDCLWQKAHGHSTPADKDSCRMSGQGRPQGHGMSIFLYFPNALTPRIGCLTQKSEAEAALCASLDFWDYI